MNPFFRSFEFGALTLRVRDLPRVQRFYQDVLGFEVWSSLDGSATLATPGSASALVELVAAPDAPPRPRATAGLFHVAFLYPDRASLASALVRVVERGVPIGSADHGVSEAIYLADPEGNGIELYADRPRDQWPPLMPDGQVAMFTEPLDVEALRSVAPTAPAAAPRIGHVHLSVADLGHAERFYGEWLGLSVTQRSYPGALFLARDGYHHHIGSNVWRTNRPAQPGVLGLDHLSIQLDDSGDVSAIAARLRAAGHAYREIPDGLATADLDGIQVSLGTGGRH
jgi:catechol 2,3-dioxygenase